MNESANHMPDHELGKKEGCRVEGKDFGRLSPKDELEHAWRYFSLHAGQRMSMLHYFMILFGLAAAGLAGCLQAGGALRFVGVGLGLTLTVISYIFYKLDERTSFLVKHGETAIKTLESSIAGNRALVFVSEPELTKNAKSMRGYWTYGKAFRWIFGVSGLVGLTGAVLAATLAFGPSEGPNKQEIRAGNSGVAPLNSGK
jgi:hypothetical protein